MNRYKHHILYFLIVLFSYSSVGCYASLYMWKWYMQEALEKEAEAYPETYLTAISVVGFNEDETEITYKGSMYDVIKIVHQNNQTTLLCLRDFTEEVLLEESNNESINEAHHLFGMALHSIKKNGVDKIQINESVFAHNHLPLDINIICKSYLFSYKKVGLEISIPPPEALS